MSSLSDCFLVVFIYRLDENVAGVYEEGDNALRTLAPSDIVPTLERADQVLVDSLDDILGDPLSAGGHKQASHHNQHKHHN